MDKDKKVRRYKVKFPIWERGRLYDIGDEVVLDERRAAIYGPDVLELIDRGEDEEIKEGEVNKSVEGPVKNRQMRRPKSKK